jgi:hypothetical protein
VLALQRTAGNRAAQAALAARASRAHVQRLQVVAADPGQVENFIKELEAAGGFSKKTGPVRDARTFVKEFSGTTA